MNIQKYKNITMETNKKLTKKILSKICINIICDEKEVDNLTREFNKKYSFHKWYRSWAKDFIDYFGSAYFISSLPKNFKGNIFLGETYIYTNKEEFIKAYEEMLNNDGIKIQAQIQAQNENKY
jgi:hypothetical protein